jgi:hypothetical protein
LLANATASPSTGAGRHSFFTAITARTHRSSAMYTTPVTPMPTTFASFTHVTTYVDAREPGLLERRQPPWPRA